MNLINFTGLSKHFSYLWMRKHLRCVSDRQWETGSINPSYEHKFSRKFHVSLALITHCVFHMKKNIVHTLNMTCFWPFKRDIRCKK